MRIGYTRLSQGMVSTIALFFVLALSFGLYVYAEKRLDRANEQRHASYLLANQLRQSSNDLSRMARLYVATKVPRYRRYYLDIVAIRDGRMGRPEGYQYAYWDMVLAGEQSAPSGGVAMALLEAMRQAGFPQGELNQLHQAKKNSDALTAIELEAMQRVERGDVQAKSAPLLLSDASYLRAKAAIMKPINAVFASMDTRTADRVRSAEATAVFFRIVFIACLIAALVLLLRAHRALHRRLGATADEIHAHMLRIGQGDLATPIALPAGMKDSILAHLCEMQKTLLAFEIERKRAEAKILRSSQLYAALSQCNQAIVRCTDVAELFPLICRDAVVLGGMKLAWIGLVDASSQRLVPRASHGAGREYVDGLQISVAADDPLGQGPTGTAIREDQPFWCQDFLQDERTAAWHEHAARHGLAASASLPLHRDGQAVGAFNVYAGEAHAFDEDIRKLLLEMAMDIGFALDNYAREQARSEAQRALAESEERHRAYVEQAVDAIFVHDYSGRFIDCNRRACISLGYSREELLQLTVFDVETDFDLVRAQAEWGKIQPGDRVKLLGHQRRKDGTSFPVEVHFGCFDRGGKRLYMGLVRDISAHVQAEEQLRIAATAFESQQAVMVTDANSVILRVSQAFTVTTGYTAEEAVGQTPRLFQSGLHNADFYRKLWARLQAKGYWQGEVMDRRKNGEVYPQWLTISAVRDAGGEVTHYVGTHLDISERKQAEERINKLAYFDPLTGLPNRALLLDRLRQAMHAGTRSGLYGAVLLIDLDNFKTLNDTLGHDMGDLLLQQVAQRLGTQVREEDTVARLGGDEFMVLLAGLGRLEAEAAAFAEAVGEKLLAVFKAPYLLGPVAYRSTPSIGATLFHGHLASIDDLMKQADLAMYKAKDAGRNLVRFFDPEMETSVLVRAALESDLRRALDSGQFLLHYQPQIAGDRLIGVEALLRWQHPERGMVSPAEFIPLAEETGLILPLGHWVLETACAQIARWAALPEMAHLTMAVNISAQQLHEPGFVDAVLGVIGKTGANPHVLKLELTESLLVHDVDSTIEKMYLLKAKGVGFSLDDFGTGYSSLSYLKRLPLDQLKIDQSFVRDVLSDPNDAAIARTIVALAQSLGLGVIAEGVETAAQRDFLMQAGCFAYQGYYFSRPLPLAEFEAYARA